MTESDYSDLPELEEATNEPAAFNADEFDLADLPMGDPTLVPTDEGIEKAMKERQEARKLVQDGQGIKAIWHLTNAIDYNPKSAIVLGERARLLYKLGERRSARKDCETAIERGAAASAPFEILGHLYYEEANALIEEYDTITSDTIEKMNIMRRLDRAELVVTEHRDGLISAIDSWNKAQQIDFKPELQMRIRTANQNLKVARTKLEDIEVRKENLEGQEAHYEDVSAQFADEFENYVPKGNSNPFKILRDEASSASGGAGISEDFMKAVMNDPNFSDSLLHDPEVTEMLSDAAKGPEAVLKHLNNPKFMQMMGLMLHAGAHVKSKKK